MRQRILASCGAAALMAAVLVATPVAGQTRSAAAKDPSAVKAFTPPKTPWGEPDLQGTWTSDAGLGIPLARPDSFGTRALLNDEEFKTRVERDERSRKAAENAVGSFRGDGAWQTKTVTRQASLIVAPEDGKMPALTPEAEKRRASRDRGTFGPGPFETTDDFTLYDRCVTRGIVGSVLPVPYGNGNRILQTPGQVVISYEMVHDTRIIPVDGRPRTGIRSYLGEPRGRWEGNTLVVETINLTDKTSIGMNGNGLRHSADMKIIERFTRTDADTIKYDITIDDPKTYVKPWTISVPLASPPGFYLLAYECHEGNYMLPAVLSGQRAEDRRIDEAAKNGIKLERRPVQFNERGELPPDAPILGGGEGGRQ